MAYDLIALLKSGVTPLYLAPQAGVSESPFRRLCRRFGADILVSEFVSAAGIVQNSKRSRDYLRFDEAERPIGIQIFGADPVLMGDAAAFVAEEADVVLSVVLGVVFSSPSRHGFWTAKGHVHSTVRTDV